MRGAAVPARGCVGAAAAVVVVVVVVVAAVCAVVGGGGAELLRVCAPGARGCCARARVTPVLGVTNAPLARRGAGAVVVVQASMAGECGAGECGSWGERWPMQCRVVLGVGGAGSAADAHAGC